MARLGAPAKGAVTETGARTDTLRSRFRRRVHRALYVLGLMYGFTMPEPPRGRGEDAPPPARPERRFDPGALALLAELPSVALETRRSAERATVRFRPA